MIASEMGRSMELAPLLKLSWSEKMSDGYYELRFFLLHLRSLQRKLSVIN
jgi:hypothetical protein